MPSALASTVYGGHASRVVLQWVTHVGTSKVVDGGLGKHGVVLEERLAQRGGVLGDDHELRLAVAEALEGGFLPQMLVPRTATAWILGRVQRSGRTYVAKSDLAGLEDERQLGADAIQRVSTMLKRARYGRVVVHTCERPS